MSSLRTRTLADGSLTYTVLYRLDGRQTSTTFDTAKAAERFREDGARLGWQAAREIADARRDAGRTNVDAPTVAELVQRHVDSRSGIKLGTRRKYERIARGLASTPLGRLPIDAATRADAARWVRDMELEHLSHKTITDRKSLVSAALKDAVDDGMINRNPLTKVRAARTERREMSILTRDEFDAVLEAAEPQWRPLLVTLITTGMRIGEATALQVRDLHLSEAPPTLTIARGWEFTGGSERILGAPKTERGRRTIALPPDAVDVLRPLATGRKPEDFVFTDKGGAIRRGQLPDRWRRWVLAAGIDRKVRVHDLRHTHAAWMIAAGVSLTALQHRLGHASITVTSDVYGHLLPEAQVQMARAAALHTSLPQIEAASAAD